MSLERFPLKLFLIDKGPLNTTDIIKYIIRGNVLLVYRSRDATAQ
jgi:hypothetical protein